MFFSQRLTNSFSLANKCFFLFYSIVSFLSCSSETLYMFFLYDRNVSKLLLKLFSNANILFNFFYYSLVYSFLNTSSKLPFSALIKWSSYFCLTSSCLLSITRLMILGVMPRFFYSRCSTILTSTRLGRVWSLLVRLCFTSTTLFVKLGYWPLPLLLLFYGDCINLPCLLPDKLKENTFLLNEF